MVRARTHAHVRLPRILSPTWLTGSRILDTCISCRWPRTTTSGMEDVRRCACACACLRARVLRRSTSPNLTRPSRGQAFLWRRHETSVAGAGALSHAVVCSVPRRPPTLGDGLTLPWYVECIFLLLDESSHSFHGPSQYLNPASPTCAASPRHISALFAHRKPNPGCANELPSPCMTRPCSTPAKHMKGRRKRGQGLANRECACDRCSG